MLGFGLLAGGLGSIGACVSDTTVTVDGGKDATGNDGSQTDATITDGGNVTDGEAGIGPAPTPDGSLVWLNHYNNNVWPFSKAFSDLAVNESGGLTYLVSGSFFAATNTHFNFGTINLGPSLGLDPVSGGVSSTGSSVWGTSPTTTAGSSNNDDTYDAVAVDGNGDIYVFGSTVSASIKLKNTLPGPTSFVAKLTATGTPVWDHVYSQAGGRVSGGPAAITIAGNKVVVAMSFSGSLTYDTATTISADAGSGDVNVFVTALDPTSGATAWAGSFGSQGYDSVNAIAGSPQGDVVITGTIGGTASGFPGAGMPLVQLGDAGTGTDLYVLKIDASGSSTYGLVFGDQNSSAQPNGIAYRNGTIAIAGQFNGNVDFGKGPLAGSSDGVVFTIDDATKKTNWVAPLTGAAYDGFITVGIDPWGEIVAAGYYGDTNASAQIGAQALPQTSTEVSGMVLAKWDGSGTLLWAHGYVPTLNGGAPPYNSPDASDITNLINPSRVMTTSTGQVVVVGTMTGGTDFGKGYQPQLSTYGWNRCTCTGKFNPCFAPCNLGSPPACCNTVTPGFSADGIVGVWQP